MWEAGWKIGGDTHSFYIKLTHACWQRSDYLKGKKKKKAHIPTPLLPLSQPKHWLCWRGHGVPAFQRKLPQKKEKLIKKKESISIPLGVKDFSKGRIHVHIHKNELRPFEHPPVSACLKMGLNNKNSQAELHVHAAKIQNLADVVLK